MNETELAATDIMEILRRLPTPRHAAAAVATVRANLFIGGGATCGDDIDRMIKDDDKAARTIYRTIINALQ